MEWASMANSTLGANTPDNIDALFNDQGGNYFF
jgi:hypothetical protein